MEAKEYLTQLCTHFMTEKGFNSQEPYRKRLAYEMEQIDVQEEHEYFVNLYNTKSRFAYNEHNLLTAYLLGVVEDFDITREAAWSQGEFPDVDMDYLPDVRDHLKQVWAAKEFGQENICEIGTYGTLGLKSALLDMTRVHGINRDEIQSITVRMEDKDDEGEALTFEKALEIYPELADYCNRNPDVTEAVKVIVNRNKSGGRHAGGLIISSKPIADFVPLEVRSVTKDNKNGVIVSAWAEGQATQDLAPVGLVKFDLLVVDGLMQIAIACKLIKERHGLETVCAQPGKRSWSDIAYLNDPKSIALADKGDVRCIFQFGSEGMRKLVKQGGVSSFDDIAAYSALYRPGPLGMGMAERFCLRKKGKEQYRLHPIMEKILGQTYGVMAYQEQVMQILNAVGNIPLIHCEKVRKAISKKKVALFIKYKDMFIKNGQRNLGVSEEYVTDLWAQIEAFADYGFNKSHSYAYSYISARQLWLMAHYPIEFYTAVLMCCKDDDKIKEIKLDAKRHGVEVLPVAINKSKQNFSIVDEKVYFGFSNIKGIGVDVADEIVKAQPYADFSDFLDKFGTESKVLKPMVALGVFEEPYERLDLYKFYEYFKDTIKKRRDRKKRNDEAMLRYDEELSTVIDSYCSDADLAAKMKQFNDEAYALWDAHLGGIEIDQEYKYKGEVRIRKITAAKLLADLKSRHDSSIKNFAEKEAKSDDKPPTLETFNPDKVKLDEEVVKLMSGDTRLAETTFYGFAWTHVLEESPDYKGLTADLLVQEHEAIGTPVGPIEIQVKGVKQKTSKNGAIYYSVDVEDSNGKMNGVTFWSDDYERFKDDLKTGNLLLLRVRPPFANFKNFTFETVPKRERWKLPQDKADDCRLVTLRPGVPKESVTKFEGCVLDLQREIDAAEAAKKGEDHGRSGSEVSEIIL